MKPWEEFAVAPEAKPWEEFAQGKPKMQNLGTPEESMRAELASRGPLERGLAGVGAFTDSAALRLKQLFGNKLTPQDEANVRDNRTISSDPAGMAGNILGSVAATGYPGAALYRGVASAAGRVLPRVLTGTAGGAVSGGTVATATNPVLPGESEAENTGMGAAGGALGDSVARVASRVAQPILQSPAVQRLLQQGVVPTLGQAAGGTVNNVEQKLQSVWGPGDFVRLARDRAQREMNVAALNKAVPPGQAKVTEMGQAGIDEAKAGIGAAYDKALGGRVMQPDVALSQSIDAAKQVPLLPLNQARQKQFDDIMQKVLWQRIPKSGDLPATSVKSEIDSDLGKLAFNLSAHSNTAEEKALGDAVRAARDSVRQWMNRQTGNGADRIAADVAHGNKADLQKAVKKAAANGGQFTPNQLQRSSKPGPLNDMANDAQGVLGNRVPNSGSVDRAMIAAALGLGGAGANEYFGGPGYLSALALAPLLYSRAGSRYMVGNLPGQRAASEALRAGAPAASQVGIAGLLNWKN